MVSKGIVCLLAFFYLVEFSQQYAHQGLDRVSSARSGQPASPEEDRSEAHASVTVRTMQQIEPGDLHPWGPDIDNRPQTCQYEDQVLNVIVNGECLVCVCVMRRNLMLEPVCGSCNNCDYRPTPPPTWPPPPPPPPPTTTVRPTPPPPPPDVPKCDPLPTNTQFQNPLDPCQLCVCVQTTDEFGNLLPPVIECQRNPECVPSTPSGPPDTLCQYYPINVWFKHPTNRCEICACYPELTLSGPVHSIMTCMHDPACDPSPPPTPPPTLPPTPPPTLPPTPPPTTVMPTEIITTTTRRPIIPTSAPMRSCYPFVPNVPFEHAWDPCQTCVCNEHHYDDGYTTIEVQCESKKECCVEWLPVKPEYTSTVLPYLHPIQISQQQPGPMYIGGYPQLQSSSASADASAEAGIGQVGLNAGVNSNLNGILPIYPWSVPSALSQSSASAEANAVSNNNIPGSVYPGKLSPVHYPYGQSSQVHSSASAEATVSNNYHQVLHPGQLVPSQSISNSNAVASVNTKPGSYYYGPGSQSQSSASAGASAVSNNNQQVIYPGPVLPGPSSNSANAGASASTNSGYPYGPGSQSNSVSNAVASANANNNNLPLVHPVKPLPQNVVNAADPSLLLSLYGLGSQSQSQANADASANSGSNIYGLGTSQAASQAEANANVFITPYQGQEQYNPNGLHVSPAYTQVLEVANTVAQANAQAQANSQAQAQAAALAQLQGTQYPLNMVNPLYAYNGGSAQAQAQASAQGQSNSQAQANAQASGDSSQAVAQAYAAAQKSGQVEEESAQAA